ncbi:hypothetical protein [Haloferax sulfurifontis]|uniref:Uncharacterized protein n=1 Tax=Haloferax sulfurifontis TaxID=255616 RepID=A0A830E2W4_9EURY|nr:hypothetical protein [Haloferax sulfurifontis]GGC48891.1 hypothetical protein GCM10007209_08160 [Haloferax sulfurifontis]
MEKPSVKCALLATMIAKHKWGTPITEEDLLSLSAIGNDYPVAREVYADLRSEPYITHRGNRGIELDESNFDKLADVLYHECRWETWEIETRLKHYEGIKDHDWG